jgi:ketosteroid isomerase-like protein
MKNMLRCAALAILLTSPFAIAQSAPQDWEAGVRQFDTAFWDAYNQCDIKKLVQLNTDDMEFYHDKGGVMIGKAKFAAAMENNICGNPAQRVRREAVADTLRIFPMHDNGKLYGAVVSGEHQFYNSAKGGPETLAGRALFTHMLLLKDGTWKVSRVLSYSHAPAAVDIKLAPIQLPAPAMARLAGSYKAKDGMTIVVKTAGDHLLATAGGSNFELYPLSETAFFMKKRDIKVAFSVDAAGKAQGLVVRENGTVVAEAAAAGQ